MTHVHFAGEQQGPISLEVSLPNFSKDLEQTLHNALAEASGRRHEYATLEHLLLALIDDPSASRVMEACGVNIDELKDIVRHYLDNELWALVPGALKEGADDTVPVEERRIEINIDDLPETDPSPTSGFQRTVQRSILHVQGSGRDEVTGANVLVALFSERESYAVYFLQQQDFSRLDAVTYISHGVGNLPETVSPSAASTHRDAKTPRKVRKGKIFVSYAWGDQSSKAARERDDIVEKLCLEAEAKGIVINRDKRVLRPGDSISFFMRKLGQADRIFVILSDRYLRSAYCMFELSEIWRNARFENRAFLSRIRVLALDDAKIFEPLDWVNWALHWRSEYEKLDSLAREHGTAVLGSFGHKKLAQMQQFYLNIPDILGSISEIVVPRTLDELRSYGFSDLFDDI